jgi:hypothetical protein
MAISHEDALKAAELTKHGSNLAKCYIDLTNKLAEYEKGSKDVKEETRKCGGSCESVPKSINLIPEAMDVVGAAINSDPEYAWSWQCNIAMAVFDAGVEHRIANEGAARFMQILFGVDMRKSPYYVALLEVDPMEHTAKVEEAPKVDLAETMLSNLKELLNTLIDEQKRFATLANKLDAGRDAPIRAAGSRDTCKDLAKIVRKMIKTVSKEKEVKEVKELEIA